VQVINYVVTKYYNFDSFLILTTKIKTKSYVYLLTISIFLSLVVADWIR